MKEVRQIVDRRYESMDRRNSGYDVVIPTISFEQESESKEARSPFKSQRNIII